MRGRFLLPQSGQPLTTWARGPYVGVYVVGQRQGTGCHDRLIELMVGAPSQLEVPGSQMGTRTDGRMGIWADEFHKSKRAIPNGGNLPT